MGDFMKTPLVPATSVALLMLAGMPAGAQAPAPALALHCGHAIDTLAGALLGPTTVVIADGRIQAVSPGRVTPPGAVTIDLSAQTCLPGLIDSHTHLSLEFTPSSYSDEFRWNLADHVLREPLYARRTLLAGFTTVRNLGDRDNEVAAMRNAINAGILVGPRIFTAGRAMGSTGGHADPTNGYRMDLAGDPGAADGIIDSPEQAAKAVRLHYKLGDDLIKIMPSGGVMDEGTNGENPQMTIEEIRAVVSTAHDYGFTVAAHAHGAEAIRRAVLGGVDSIEHGTLMNEEDIKLMKEHGTWYVPTLSAGAWVARKARIPGYYPPQVAAKALAIGAQIAATAGRAYKAGVKIAFGTDGGVYPHGENAGEFVLMNQAGIPAMVSLQAATIRAAQLLRHDRELGSLTQGKLADVVAVTGDPLADISLMQHMNFVMKQGIVYLRDGRPTPEATAQ